MTLVVAFFALFPFCTSCIKKVHKNAGEALVGVQRNPELKIIPDAIIDGARKKDADELFKVMKTLLSGRTTKLSFETSDPCRSQLEA